MRLPAWIRATHRHADLRPLKGLLRHHGLSTVCEEARCPNQAWCFSRPTATFMILGSRCTRNCGFCAVDSGVPLDVDMEEPRRVAEAARQMGLRYVVVTSVSRDDLPDGGAGQFALTIRSLRDELPEARVEVLTPDFRGDREALRTVLDAGPNVFNHNVETVPSFYATVRPGADYRRSLDLLRAAGQTSQDLRTKSGLMLGLGETMGEVIRVLHDLRDVGCEMLTVGQYLRPTRRNLPVREYVTPEAFDRLKEKAVDMGFRFVASGPLVRSSMNAEEMYEREEGAGHV